MWGFCLLQDFLNVLKHWGLGKEHNDVKLPQCKIYGGGWGALHPEAVGWEVLPI
jgi:hypothetical protein